MNAINKTVDSIKKINYILSRQQKQYGIVVLIMGIIAALLELLGVAIIIPILNMMLDMNATREKWYIQKASSIFNLDTDLKLVWFICGLTIMVYLFKNLFFSVYSWVSSKYSMKIQRELAIRVMQIYMRQGYVFFMQNNTARLLQGMTSDVSGVYNILNTFFTLIVKILTLISIAGFIVIQSKDLALVLIALAIISFTIIQLLFRRSMDRNGKLAWKYACECSRTSIEAMQGNKEILVMNKQDFFVKHYSELLAGSNRVAVKLNMGAVLPSYIIEMICIGGVLIAMAVQMGIAEDTYALITSLSVIAVGAFRMLPALGGITSGINSITSYLAQLDSAYSTLTMVKDLENKENVNVGSQHNEEGEIVFKSKLEIKNISFAYPDTDDNVLENVSFSIKEGQSIGLIGPSGAGKTTLVDIILSLLKPSMGEILIDGINIEDLGGRWNDIIGYVPQSLYILDDSIRRNVAFGEPIENIDDEKVWEALKIAQLEEFVKTLPQQLETQVGEWGVHFSGGQRQRMAIARALYRNPEILVLDEATAALDNETEKDVMQAIENLQGYKTLIIVAHRLSTVRNCDVIYEVRDKSIFKKNKEEVFSE